MTNEEYKEFVDKTRKAGKVAERMACLLKELAELEKDLLSLIPELEEQTITIFKR